MRALVIASHAGGDCPLDAEARVDVSVDVRGQPLPRPTVREPAPMLCALRLGIPVVVRAVGRRHL